MDALDRLPAPARTRSLPTLAGLPGKTSRDHTRRHRPDPHPHGRRLRQNDQGRRQLQRRRRLPTGCRIQRGDRRGCQPPTAKEAQSLDDPNMLPAPDDLHSPSSTQDTTTLSWFSIRHAGEYKLLRKKDGTDEWVRVPGSFDNLPSRTPRQLRTT